MAEKLVQESFTVMNELVLPSDTNVFNNLMGGRLMYWMDIAGSMVALKHSNMPCMTASVDNISFKSPIKLGNVVHIEASITRSFTSSMEIFIRVRCEDVQTRLAYESNTAYFTFVGLDANNKPKPVPAVVPQTEEEIKLFSGALRRRQLRLVLAGKMQPQEAKELKDIFIP